MIQKADIRRQVSSLKARHASSAMRQSAEVMAKLEASPAFRAAKTVLLYHSLPDEVATHEFVSRWSGEKQILLPVVVGDELELRRYDGALTTGAYGIGEPAGAAFTEYDTIDLAVIPGVAFDPEGNRLGRGKGYYDRLLPRLRKTRKVGICFPYQLVAHVPTEPHDVPVDEVVTCIL